ncbi:MAG: Flp family type IVb pilin [Acidobacteriota bacterium]
MLSRSFLQDEEGQDLVEYSLLLAFVCLAGAATFIAMGTTIGSIWTLANNRLAAANCTSNCSGS